IFLWHDNKQISVNLNIFYNRTYSFCSLSGKATEKLTTFSLKSYTNITKCIGAGLASCQDQTPISRLPPFPVITP
ncbi:hypothetical protein ACO0LB_20875, partial [Undibacterium sp. SXout7W]|uniref:hypothetical protein n=1 Tax=Undibacterium sp. SXout7W TaxID=3413049 RepID=UPI003BF0B182